MEIKISSNEYKLIQSGLATYYNTIEHFAFQKEKGKNVGEGKEKELDLLEKINDLQRKLRKQVENK